MGSFFIHLSVASEVNKVLHRENNELLIGAIAPDVSKLIGENKKYSHFYSNEELPDLNKFLSKYGKKLDNDFVMGYFIHLCTDYLWNKYFIPSITNNKKMIYKLNGDSIEYTKDLFKEYIYNDYTNMNIKLLNEYNLDLDFFYSSVPKLKNIISEIPMDKINIVINEGANILKKTEENTEYIFDIDDIKEFINMNIDFILSTLHDYYKDHN